jgi:PRTRC genetic system protein C
MEVSKSVRSFTYNGVALADPGAQFTLEQVREFFSALYPDILNAAIEGPTITGNKLVYEFRRAVGTKGNDVAGRVDAMIERNVSGSRSVVIPRAMSRFHGSISESMGRGPDYMSGRFRGVVDEPVLLRSACMPLLP